MQSFDITDYRTACRHAALAAMLVGVTACTATTASRPPAHVEVQQGIGFTITEEVPADSAVRADYQQALYLIEQGRETEGIELLEAVVRAAPHLSAPLIDLGIAQHRAGDLEAAEKTLRLALEANPNHPVAHNELGIVLRKTGRFEEAKASYEAALATYPGYHYARRNLAVLCDLYLAEPECALDNYKAYMSTVTGDEEASMWISDIESRLGQTE